MDLELLPHYKSDVGAESGVQVQSNNSTSGTSELKAHIIILSREFWGAGGVVPPQTTKESTADIESLARGENYSA